LNSPCVMMVTAPILSFTDCLPTVSRAAFHALMLMRIKRVSVRCYAFFHRALAALVATLERCAFVMVLRRRLPPI